MVLLSTLVAGVGSCSGFICSNPDPNDLSVTVPGITGGITLTIGLLFTLTAANWYRMKLFAVIGAGSYVAGVIGAWFILIIPILIGLAINFIVGVIAHRIARKDPDSARMSAKATGLLCGGATIVASTSFVVGQLVASNGYSGSDSGVTIDMVRPMLFAIVAGSFPPLISAIVAWWAGREMKPASAEIYRDGDPEVM